MAGDLPLPRLVGLIYKCLYEAGAGSVCIIFMAGKRARAQDRWCEAFKRGIVAEAAASDASTSEIARQNGLNSNLVFS